MQVSTTEEKIIPISEAQSPTAEPIQSKGYQRPILEILKDFQKPIPKRFIKTKTIKGQRIDFVSWYSYIRLLEYFAPGFGWEVRTHYNGDRTVVEGRLTIRAAEGNFIRESTGTEDNELILGEIPRVIRRRWHSGDVVPNLVWDYTCGRNDNERIDAVYIPDSISIFSTIACSWR